jgi:hypothetical protein
MKRYAIREVAISRRHLYSACAIFGLICTIFAATAVAPKGARADVQNADDLLVVDCLLPGKVRRLGRRTTYVTARKAVKTTASECAIRGGEYTQADRASYATAIKIWLPLAKDGDPVAQTYVGEIYEKGLGVPPEFALAAKWYRMAAEQGHSRAQLNLGALYEKGLGVAKDQKEAVSWYRRASGLEASAVPYVPAETEAELKQLRAEKEKLRAEKEALEKERDALRQQLKDNRKQLSEAQTRYKKSVTSSDTARKALAAAQKKLEADVKAGRQDRILDISKELAARSAELAKREGEASRLRVQVTDLERKSSSLQSELQEERSGRDEDVKRYKAEADAARAQAARVSRQLKDAESASTTQQRRAEEKRRQVAALKAKLVAERKQTRAEKAKEATLKDQLAARQRALAAERDKAASLESEAAALKQEAAALQQEKAERSAAEAKIAVLQADLRRQQESAKHDKAQEAALQRRLEEQQRTVTAAQEKSASLETRAAQLEERSRRLDAERAKRSEAERKLSALQAEAAGRRKEVAKNKERESRLQKQLSAQQRALTAERKKAASLVAQAADLKKQAAKLRKENADREAAAAQLAASAPAIEIIEPQLPRTRTAGLPTIVAQGGDTKTVIGRVQAPTGLMTLMINDIEQTIGDDGMFRANVPLPAAENKVNIVAVDKKGRRIETAFLITRPVGSVRGASGEAPRLVPQKLEVEFGTFHAVVIGNNDYTMMPKLKTAATDAEAVARLLEERYGFKVTLLLNANRYAILSALNKAREALTEDDNLLIYYAGHGELDRVNNRGNWLPVDAEPDSSANWISNIQITDVLNAMSVRQVMVVADSCYSGTLTRAAVARLDAGMNEKTRNNWIKLMAEKRSRVVLSSGGVQPVLDSGGGDHSVFASAFLNVLSGNADIMEGQRLFSLVAQQVTNVGAAAQIEQVPQYAPIKFAGHEAGDFFFVPITN